MEQRSTHHRPSLRKRHPLWRCLLRRGPIASPTPPTARPPGGWSIVAWVVVCSSLVHPLCIHRSIYAAELTPATVNRAINRGIEYLRSIQNDNGGWNEFTGQSCGLSALCTLAMVNAGIDAGDPSVGSAIKYLRGKTPDETYSVALQTLVFCDLGSPADLRLIRRNVDWLVANQTTSGSWSYGNVGATRRGGGDPSNAQFALLALGAARTRGIEVPAAVFEASTKYWASQQQTSGGWSYSSSGRATGSMTCAGVASLIIGQSNLRVGAASIVGDKIQCCGGDDAGDRIAKGLRWLGANFTTAKNPRAGSNSHLYYLYALERTGRLSGRRFIGGHDWYREGADRLLSIQDVFKGYWRGNSALEPPAVATSFAVLFLSKGRRKVVLGQLKYADNDDVWRRHRGAVAGLVGRVETAWKQKLTWQTIDLPRAGLNDLLQAPVILITGSGPIDIDPADAERLGEYINQGGTVLFDADGGRGCGDPSSFNADVLRLTKQWVPGGKMQRMPPEHPVWSAEAIVDVDSLAPNEWVYGVDACCRTSIFYFPGSLSCRWALADAVTAANQAQVSDAAKRQIDVAADIGQNILAYATGRELKDKLQSSVLVGVDEVPPIDRNTIRMARLVTGSDTAGADRAASHAAQFASTGTAVAITTLDDAVGFETDVLRDIQFLWVHGRGAVTWDDQQIAVLRQFITNGGVILASAICGDETFGDSFSKIAPLLTDGQSLTRIGEDHPMMRMAGGFDLSTVVTRLPRTDTNGTNGNAGGGVALKRTTPLLSVATDPYDLVTIVFSPLDLSCALESPNSIQCPGYSTSDAAKIVTNMILFGLSQ